MDETVYDIWKSIDESKITKNGDWVVYTVKPHKGDNEIHFYHTRSKRTYSFDRGESTSMDPDDMFCAFWIKPHADSVYQMRKRKVADDKLPGDTLAVFYFEEKKLSKIPNVSEFQLPSEWGGVLAYKRESLTAELDSTAYKALVKDENAENGGRYIIRQVDSEADIAIPFCKKLVFSPKKGWYAYETTGQDTLNETALYLRDLAARDPRLVTKEEGKYSNISFSEKGKYVSYVANYDTTDAQITPFELFVSEVKLPKPRLVADNSSPFLDNGWILNGDKKAHFSKDESRLFFYSQREPVLQDTSILDDEIVDVEVWTSADKLLYTQQENRLDREKRRGYSHVMDLKTGTIQSLADTQYDEVRLFDEGNGNMAFAFDEKPYHKMISYEGYPDKNLALINLTTGNKEEVIKRLNGFPNWSGEGKYIYWYDRRAKVYKALDVAKKKELVLTDNDEVLFYNEIHDQPADPWNYGTLGWSTDDKALYVYDRYDIWKIVPGTKRKNKRITNGRDRQLRVRHISLDDEVTNFPEDTTLLVSIFNENDKSGGIAWLDLSTGTLEEIESGPYQYRRNFIKAEEANDIVFTRENFETFPNLIHTAGDFKDLNVFSDANPQQSEYAWGTIELIRWKTESGKDMQGMLVKPPGFDPEKKYPMLVNFYEKSAQNLHRHRAPYAHRSTINYSYYANQGYVIFNPDVPYTIGYPGDSGLEAVMSGVDAVLELGFVDESRMGLQGHSWGGYQVAYILVKTGRFACAESGAPVVNMTSAYGGIRWGSGMSRMFQYEKTQSRLGATLWEAPERYLENSPLFELDKMTTPVLILHNDKDGAVPWYQGIEYFVALRRLNKEAWFLNYNDEPHWPVKRQNRLDFNKRMQQFFGYYLKGEPIPQWMHKGVSPMDKGINQGLEYLNK